MKSHRDLDVWKKSMDLVTEIYCLTKQFPKDDLYGLSAQIRRAAISIPGNIAEGAARNSDKEFIHFLYVALGSLSELETQMLIAEKLQFIDSPADFVAQIAAIRKMLTGLITYVRKKSLNGNGKRFFLLLSCQPLLYFHEN